LDTLSELFDKLSISLVSTYLYLHRNLPTQLFVYFHFPPFAAIDFLVMVQYLATKRHHFL